MLDREPAVTSLCVVMPPTLAEQVITLMVAANDLTLVQAMREELMSRKTDLIIVVCIFIGMVTFFAFMARGQIREYRRSGHKLPPDKNRPW